MPKYIVKFTKDKIEKYLEWSTVVDAPVTHGMSLDEFKEYYKQTYGQTAYDHDLPERLARVEKTGTSCIDQTLKQVISGNRASVDETLLTLDELWDTYCTQKD